MDIRPCDREEDMLVEDFMQRGCGCNKTRLGFRELSTKELDLIVMGQLIASTNTSAEVVTTSRHTPLERKKNYTSHFHQGKVICRKMFLFIHSISKKRMKNIKHSLASDGVGFRVHGNAKRLPKHTLSLDSVEYVIRFLLNYTQQHGLLLPGRVPGYSRDDIKLLPSSVSKRGIWKVYHEAAQKADSIHAVAYTTLRIYIYIYIREEVIYIRYVYIYIFIYMWPYVNLYTHAREIIAKKRP